LRIAATSPAAWSGSCNGSGHGRTRGKSDAIDALAIARAALREPDLDSPRPEEARLRELKLLVDHRDDLVAERRRCQQRLRWHLHELDPGLQVPLGALDRPSGLTGSAAGWRVASNGRRCGSHAICSPAAAA
jgi:transposase